jgi:hypothetical protein
MLQRDDSQQHERYDPHGSLSVGHDDRVDLASALADDVEDSFMTKGRFLKGRSKGSLDDSSGCDERVPPMSATSNPATAAEEDLVIFDRDVAGLTQKTNRVKFEAWYRTGRERDV